jgi:hypothetical protein
MARKTNKLKVTVCDELREELDKLTRIQRREVARMSRWIARRAASGLYRTSRR